MLSTFEQNSLGIFKLIKPRGYSLDRFQNLRRLFLTPIKPLGKHVRPKPVYVVHYHPEVFSTKSHDSTAYIRKDYGSTRLQPLCFTVFVFLFRKVPKANAPIKHSLSLCD
jgi:hypothetical protein